MGSQSQTLTRNSNHCTIMILVITLFLSIPLSLSSPIEILSYTADDSSHSHSMQGVPGSEVSGEFQFKAPDTDTVFHLSYTADTDGFQAVGDHLPVSVKVPEVELPVMVDYTNEVAAARENFLQTQAEVRSWGSAEVTERRRRREADPVVIPSASTGVVYPSVAASTSLPAPGFYPLGSTHPVYRTYPTHYIPTQTIVTGQAPIVQRHLYLHYPSLGLIPQVQSPVESTIQEGEEEPAALSL